MSEQYPQQPGSLLDIRPSFIFLAFLLYFFKPYYSINRSPAVAGRWKSNAVPVPPGRYEVAVWVSYLFRPQMGLNTIVVDVPPGAATVVTWRAPFTIFGSGRMRVAGVGPLEAGHGAPGWQPQQSHQLPQQPRHQLPEQQPQQQPVSSASAPGGWHPDPTGRHEVRYYDGSRWTENVGDAGSQSFDPIG